MPLNAKNILHLSYHGFIFSFLSKDTSTCELCYVGRVFFHLPDAAQPFTRLHPQILELYLEGMYNAPEQNEVLLVYHTYIYIYVCVYINTILYCISYCVKYHIMLY